LKQIATESFRTNENCRFSTTTNSVISYPSNAPCKTFLTAYYISRPTCFTCSQWMSQIAHNKCMLVFAGTHVDSSGRSAEYNSSLYTHSVRSQGSRTVRRSRSRTCQADSRTPTTTCSDGELRPGPGRPTTRRRRAELQRFCEQLHHVE
jgi:hypothetical protein